MVKWLELELELELELKLKLKLELGLENGYERLLYEHRKGRMLALRIGLSARRVHEELPGPPPQHLPSRHGHGSSSYLYNRTGWVGGVLVVGWWGGWVW